MVNPPSRRLVRHIGWAACAVALTTAAVALAAADPVIGGPSELLPHLAGASPYTGVGRYEGRATCTAFFLDTGPLLPEAANAPAYVLTSGHCPAVPGPNGVILGGTGIGRMVFNFFIDSESRQWPVPVARTAYATMKGQDVAVLELTASYRELSSQLIRPLRIGPKERMTVGEPIDIVGAPLWPDLAQSFLRVSRCQIRGVAPLVIEHLWHWFDAPFNGCRDILPGSSGSAVISVIDHQVVGIVNTTTLDAPPLSDCALGNPCEPVTGGGRSQRGTTYFVPLAAIMACFDLRRRFDVRAPGCSLDTGSGPVATPDHVGPVNPFLRTQPIGPVRRTWGVTVSGIPSSYRFTVVTPPFDDCRTTRAYSNPISVSAMPMIDAPLPLAEGFAFLCIVEATSAVSTVGELHEHPTIVMARTDLTAPRLPAQIAVVDAENAWRILFSTVGQEIAFHVYKAGPPAETRCDDPAGYRLVMTNVIGLPKVTGPYLLCAIPYDAAQNPGAIFQRLLS